MKNRRAFTLTEILCVITILGLLIGIVYFASASVREKARQTHCMSNLRQIGVALSQYRADYDGSDTTKDANALGLPHGLWAWTMRGYVKDTRVFECPDNVDNNTAKGKGIKKRLGFTLGYLWGLNTPLPPLWFPGEVPNEERLAKKGMQLPIVLCDHHDFPRDDLAYQERYLLFLRLDGSVDSVYVAPNRHSWDY